MPRFPAQTSGIRAALEGIGIRVNDIEVSHYSADHFGNLVAAVSSEIGTFKVVYDRHFEILEGSGLDHNARARIIRALIDGRRSSGW